jgi:hypothetical protein
VAAEAAPVLRVLAAHTAEAVVVIVVEDPEAAEEDAEAAAEEDGGKREKFETYNLSFETKMNGILRICFGIRGALQNGILRYSRMESCATCVAVLVGFAGSAFGATGETGRLYATPQEAVDALKAATAAGDTNGLRKIFGPTAEDLLNPDRVQATNEIKSFSDALIQTNSLRKISDREMVLEVGDDAYPFPVPLVKTNGGWYFDTDVGRDELLTRRIGRNELGTIPVMRAYVDAQRDYASVDRDGDDVLEYAQRLVSSPGNQDGLYWPPAYEGDESPLGPLVAYAAEEGYNPVQEDEGEEATRGPYHGYLFKILKRQGKHAPGGKYNYIINGNMIGGFALVAWPAEYGESGIMTFIVNQQGRIYQKDLGPKTSKIAGKMTEYDPDPSWKICRD